MNTEFGKLLRNRRRRLGLSQEELAKKAKIEKTYVSRLESSDSNPSFSTIENICKGLGLTLSEFFSGIEEAKKEPIIIEQYRKSKKQIGQLKAEMIPIRVVKGLNAFSQERDITQEFTAKYIIVEKEMLSNLKDIKDIIGAEIEKDFVLSTLKFKKLIFLIDIVHKEIKSFGFYLVEIKDPGEILIMRVEENEDKIIFFEESPIEKRKRLSYISKDYKIIDKSELDTNLIRGKVIGIIGRL